MRNKFMIPSISKQKETLSLDHNHVMTHNFGVHQIVSVIDVIPNEDITVDLSGFTRLMPLPCPTYGGVKLTHRAYFVPLEFCFKGFNSFVSFQDQPYIPQPRVDGAELSSFRMPYFTPADVFEVFFDSGSLSTPSQLPDSTDYLTRLTGIDPTVDHYDLIAYGSNDSEPTKYYNYTLKGRKIVSWLAQLGYKLPPTCSDNYQNSKMYCVDALFAFWKYYLDWIVPSRFVLDEPRFVYVKGVLDNLECNAGQYHLTRINVTPANYQLDLEQFLFVPTSFLDDDFYTSAFITPYGTEVESTKISSGIVSPSFNNGYSGYSDLSYYNQDEGSLAEAVSGSETNLTQIALLSLGRLQLLVNQKKITNSDVLAFLRANFGIAPSHDVMRMSSYLGGKDSQISIGDVMATATTDSSLGTTVVGQYSGKGIGGSSGSWRVRSEQHGILFITCEISTKSSYVNGVSPLRSRFEPLDFFNEKFDNLGVRAVRRDELIMNTFESLRVKPSSYPHPDTIFGFHPRYSEYKYHDDVVSGDFMFPSVNTGLDSWYLSRKFEVTENPVISLEFLSATSDSVGSQYDRIFQNVNPIDHFYSIYHVGVHDTSIKEKFFDYFKSQNETEVDRKEMDVEIN